MIDIILIIVFVILVAVLPMIVLKRQEYETRINRHWNTIGILEEREEAWESTALSLEKQLARKLHRKARTIQQMRPITE